MKAKLMKDGYIRVKAESIEEGFALKHLFETKDKCEKCQFPEGLILIDHTILENKKKKNKTDTVTER